MASDFRRAGWRGLAAAAALAATGVAQAVLPVTSSHRFDELYYLQPHNSYEHGTRLAAWLDAGYRTLEIDVQDTEDWLLAPRGPFVTHDKPGDHNCRGTLDRLADCLEDVMAWQDANPGALPIVLFIDMKSRVVPAYLSLWEPHEIVALDRLVGRLLGHRLYRHADLRAHVAAAPGASTRERLRFAGWPTADALRGRIIVAFTGGRIDRANARMADAQSILGASANVFLCPNVDAGDPDGISSRVDGASDTVAGEFLCANVKAGDHYQRVANRSAEWRQLMHLWSAAGKFASDSFEAAFLAVAHGASAIGLDVTTALDDPRPFVPEYARAGGAIPLVGVRRSLPGYFALRIETAGGGVLCVGARRDRSANGTALDAEPCTDGADQQFVYTAEGQLRPRADNRACMDIAGGTAASGRALHLWDCDGGDSEKWRITPAGRLQSVAGSGGFCATAPADGTPGVLRLSACSDAPTQRFRLMPVPDWAQSTF
jgi:hypothetical protein